MNNALENFITFCDDMMIANEGFDLKGIANKVIVCINNIINKIRSWIVTIKKKALKDKEVKVESNAWYLVRTNANWFYDMITNIKNCDSKDALDKEVDYYEKQNNIKFGKLMKEKSKNNITTGTKLETIKMTELLNMQEKILCFMNEVIKEVKKIDTEDSSLKTMKCSLIQKVCNDYYKAVNNVMHTIRIRNVNNVKSVARGMTDRAKDIVYGNNYDYDFDDDYEIYDDYDSIFD